MCKWKSLLYFSEIDCHLKNLVNTALVLGQGVVDARGWEKNKFIDQLFI